MESIRLCIAAIVALGLLEIHPLAEAGEADAAGSKTENNIADANNPLAKTSAFNLQNQFTGNLSVIDEPANSLLFRAAVPVSAFDSTVLFRATLPVNTFPDGRGAGHETGLGDFNIFAAYLIDTGDPTLSFGIGPQITVPTATDDALGSGKWSAGFANVLFSAADPVFQWGYLLTWQASFAGEGGGEMM